MWKVINYEAIFFPYIWKFSIKIVKIIVDEKIYTIIYWLFLFSTILGEKHDDFFKNQFEINYKEEMNWNGAVVKSLI